METTQQDPVKTIHHRPTDVTMNGYASAQHAELSCGHQIFFVFNKQHVAGDEVHCYRCPLEGSRPPVRSITQILSS